MLPSSPLTSKEGEVLLYLVEGLSRSEIARVVGVSDGTVKKRVQQILTKFKGANSRDVFAQLKEFCDLYIIGEHRLFYHRTKIVTTFLEDMASNRITKNSDVEVVYKDFSEDRLLLYSRDGVIDYVTYNGLPMTLEREVNAKSLLSENFQSRLRQVHGF